MAAEMKPEISTLLKDEDPMGIYFEDFGNEDEYDSEAAELAWLLPSCGTRQAYRDAVNAVFRTHFGDLIDSRSERLERLADRLWEHRQSRSS